MLEIYIDGQSVVTDQETTIALIKENTSLTYSGSYTYDIEIPLVGNTSNAKIFGNIHRVEIGYSDISYSAKIVLNNVTVIEGTASVLSASNTSVSIQILEGNAEFNYREKALNTYINQLEIGLIDETSLYEIANFPEWDKSELEQELYGAYQPGVVDYVLFPIQSSDSDSARNDYKIVCDSVGNYSVGYSDNLQFALQETNYKNLAPQPYLCYILNNVIEQIGYTLSYNYLLETPLVNLFIANAKPTFILADMLPEWTVLDFFTYIENFAGVVFEVNEKAKTISIEKRCYTERGDFVYITSVLDEIEKEYEEDDYSDISVANIGYDKDFTDSYALIDEEIIYAAEKVVVENTAAAKAYLEEIDEDERQNYLFLINDTQWLCIDTEEIELQEVNQFRNLTRRVDEDVDIELQIVPADMVAGSITLDQVVREIEIRDEYSDTQGPVYEYEYETYTIPLTIIQTSESDTVATYPFNIASAIDGEVDYENTPPDKLEVAFNEAKVSSIVPDEWQLINLYQPHTHYSDPVPCVSNRTSSLELNAVSGRTTLYNIAYEAVHTVEKRITYTIYFESDVILNPSQTFVINNKVYACESLEYTLTSTGMERVVKGTFYMIEQN